MPFGVVCFRAVPPGLRGDGAAVDAHNERLMHGLNASGRLLLSHTRLGGRLVLRLAIGNLATTEADVRAAWEAIRQESARSVGRG